MPTATQETSTPEWLTKQEAAKRLDLSPQRVLAMAKARQIGSKRERDPVTRQKIVLLHAGDVERICYDRDHPKPKAPLTKRENAVTEAVAAAKSNGDIAAELCVKVDTVESHLNRIYEKLGVGGRLELIMNALTRNPAYEAEREARIWHWLVALPRYRRLGRQL